MGDAEHTVNLWKDLFRAVWNPEKSAGNGSNCFAALIKLTKVPNMENSSMLWRTIADLLESIGLPQVSELEAMVILAAAFLVLLFILWLIFRKARLWYWKTNVQIDTLKSIDGRLHDMEEKLSLHTVGASVCAEGDPQEQNETGPEQEDAKEIQESAAVGMIAVGRSGRVYTEAELELQIRD